MAQATSVIVAEAKERVGKGAARAIRRSGRIPAVIYGDHKDPICVSLTERDLIKTLSAGGFFTKIVTLEVGKDKHMVLPRDVQYHPVTDRAIHVDFLRVTAKTKIAVEVPARFINEEASPGLKKGGILNIVRHKIEVFCSATDIPESIEFDLTGLELNESVHMSNAKLPAGVVPTIDDRDFTVASVTAPSALRSKADSEGTDEEAEASEGEGESEEKAESAE